MSSNDKTRQKLVDSMRRTKVSATKKAAPKAKVEAKQAPATQPAPTAKKAQVKKAQPTTAAKKVTSAVAADHYQSGQRIWPD
jgi:hypothetical protein